MIRRTGPGLQGRVGGGGCGGEGEGGGGRGGGEAKACLSPVGYGRCAPPPHPPAPAPGPPARRVFWGRYRPDRSSPETKITTAALKKALAESDHPTEIAEDLAELHDPQKILKLRQHQGSPSPEQTSLQIEELSAELN